MLNLLIANRNLLNLQSLQNCISQYVPQARISCIAKNGKEVLEALNKYHYDLALIDMELPIYDGFDILQKVSEVGKIEYHKSFIFLSHNETIVKNLKSHYLTYDAIQDTEPFSRIITSIKSYVDSTSSEPKTSYVKTKIINELQNIGYNLSHNGTHYLAETVYLIATLNYDSENLTKNTYPKVSQIYKKSLNNIKSNIITATDAACKNIDKKVLEKHLKLSSDIKPTAKMVIYSILQKL